MKKKIQFRTIIALCSKDNTTHKKLLNHKICQPTFDSQPLRVSL